MIKMGSFVTHIYDIHKVLGIVCGRQTVGKQPALCVYLGNEARRGQFRLYEESPFNQISYRKWYLEENLREINEVEGVIDFDFEDLHFIKCKINNNVPLTIDSSFWTNHENW